jgi:hypothetical protein
LEQDRICVLERRSNPAALSKDILVGYGCLGTRRGYGLQRRHTHCRGNADHFHKSPALIKSGAPADCHRHVGDEAGPIQIDTL